MILIDTSAWVEFLRNTGSPVCQRVDAYVGSDIATCELVAMEMLAGARDDRHLFDLRRLLATTTVLSTKSTDFEEAASMYRICRRNGATPRKLIDCLIAAIAIRSMVSVLHADEDFDVIALSTALVIA